MLTDPGGAGRTSATRVGGWAPRSDSGVRPRCRFSGVVLVSRTGDNGRMPVDRGVVILRDVSLRDGLQDEAPIPTEAKVALFEALADAGVRDLEMTSFVRPDRVPALADAEALVAATAELAATHGVTRWGLVLNARGAERALAAGVDHLQYVVSVSDTHSRHNAGTGTDEALDAFDRIASDALEQGATVEATLATAFGCPFEHRVEPDRVAAVARRVVEAGASSIGLADTIGVAVPTEVATLVDRVTGEIDVAVGAHLHDTRGLAIANALAALDHGAVRLDASVGGLGGCPFAPNASGNVPIEDLAHALGEMGYRTGVDVPALVEAARLACELTGRSVESHIGLAGPRFT